MSRGKRRIALAALYLAWLFWPAAVFANGSIAGGGFDDRCLGAFVWSNAVDEGATIESRGQSWPPLSMRCIASGPSGGIVAQQTYPGPLTYAAVLTLLAAPFAFWPVAKRLAREAQFNRPPRPG